MNVVWWSLVCFSLSVLSRGGEPSTRAALRTRVLRRLSVGPGGGQQRPLPGLPGSPHTMGDGGDSQRVVVILICFPCVKNVLTGPFVTCV